MELYIQLQDGQPVGHPIHGDNFREAFPHIDVNNLPSNFAVFKRIPVPVVGPYEINEGVTYEKVGDVYLDKHNIRPMTAEEKAIKVNSTIAEWNNKYPSWVFNETICSFEPPIAYPLDGKYYMWNEDILSWAEVK